MARMVIKDHILSIGGIENFSVTKEMLLECKDAYRRYQDNLKLKKVLKGESDKAVKRKAVQDEIRVLKRMRTEIDDVKNDLQKDCDRYLKNAEKERKVDLKLRLFSKASKLRDGVVSKEEEFQHD